MNLPTHYATGTVSVGVAGSTVTGVGSLWGAGGVDDNIMVGDLFSVPSQPMVPAVIISGITADGTLQLMWPWPGTAVTAQPYVIRYVGIIERSTRANRMALELMGQVSAFFDVQVNDTAARLALETSDNPLRANYRVMVSDIGDGSSAIYSKSSGAYGAWTAPAPYSGPIGPPGPVGINWSAAAYSAGTVYAVRDGVRFNGSSFRKLIVSSAGNPPSSASPPVDNSHWAVVAAKGQDGAGTGDVVGPASSVDLRLAVFSGTSGKQLIDGGQTVASLAPADDSISNAKLANVPTGTIKGRLTAAAGDPEDLTPQQARTVMGMDAGYPLFMVSEQLAAGVSATYGAVGFNTRRFNTIETNEISGASLNLSTYEVTLPAGTYWVEASGVVYNKVTRTRVILRDVAAISNVLGGFSQYVGPVEGNAICSLSGRLIVPSGGKAYTLLHYLTAAPSADVLGVSVGASLFTERYAEFKAWKLK